MKYKIVIIILIVVTYGCSKQNQWLDVKSNKADVTPASWADYQALLDNDQVMNAYYPSLGLLGADNYYITTTTWQANTATERNSYTWVPEIFEGESSASWTRTYRMIEYANIVLSGIRNLSEQSVSQAERDNITGSALFFRACGFYNLLQEVAPPFNAATATSDLGIVLRLTDDVNERSYRSTVLQCYNQVKDDLLKAKKLLPVSQAAKTRPNSAAASSLLAKLFLTIGDYHSAIVYADSALAVYNTLIDFNTLDPAATRPFPTLQNNNKEVIFHALANNYGVMIGSAFLVDTTLYRSYHINDLRRTIFYKTNTNGTVNFKGTYSGISTFFSGIATNELYLIKAECEARTGNTTIALNALNALLLKRWKQGTFVNFTASNSDEALQKILIERRKELPFTGNSRWEDLRRLNLDSRFATTLTRSVNNQLFTLQPNSPRYVYPIPDDEIRYSNLPQNPR